MCTSNPPKYVNLLLPHGLSSNQIHHVKNTLRALLKFLMAAKPFETWFTNELLCHFKAKLLELFSSSTYRRVKKITSSLSFNWVKMIVIVLTFYYLLANGILKEPVKFKVLSSRRSGDSSSLKEQIAIAHNLTGCSRESIFKWYSHSCWHSLEQATIGMYVGKREYLMYLGFVL